MIYLRDEGQVVRNGLNIYPLSSFSSAGFIFKIKNFAWRMRYSKVTKKWFIGKSTV